MPRVCRTLVAILLISDTLLPSLALAKRETQTPCATAECRNPLQKAILDAGSAFSKGKALEQSLPQTNLEEVKKTADKAQWDEFTKTLDSAKKLQLALLPKKQTMPAVERVKYLETIKNISDGLGLDQEGLKNAESAYLPPPDTKDSAQKPNTPQLTPEETRKMLAESAQKVNASTNRVGKRSEDISSRLKNDRTAEDLDGVNSANGNPMGKVSSAAERNIAANKPPAQLRRDFRYFSDEPGKGTLVFENTPPKQEEKGMLADYNKAVAGHMKDWDKKARAIGDAGTAHLVAANNPDTPGWKKPLHVVAAGGLAVAEGVTDLIALNQGTWKKAAAGAAIAVGATLLVLAAVPAAAAAVGIASTATISAGAGGFAVGAIKAVSIASAVYFIPTSLRDLAAKPSVGTAIMAGVSVIPLPGGHYLANALKSTGAANYLIGQAAAAGTVKGATALYKFATQKAVAQGAHTVIHQTAHAGAGAATGGH